MCVCRIYIHSKDCIKSFLYLNNFLIKNLPRMLQTSERVKIHFFGDKKVGKTTLISNFWKCH